MRKVDRVHDFQRACIVDSEYQHNMWPELTFLNAMLPFVIQEWGLKCDKFCQFIRSEEVEDGRSQGQVESSIQVPVYKLFINLVSNLI